MCASSHIIRRSGAALGGVVGVLVLLGYALDFPPAWRPVPGLPATHPNTALCLVLLGGSVWMGLRAERFWHAAARVAVLAAAGLMLLRLAVPLFGNDLLEAVTPFESIRSAEAAAGQPIGIGTNTALALLGLVIAEVFYWLRRPTAAQLAACLALAAVFIAIIGYLDGVSQFYGRLAPSTIVGMLPLAAAALFARPGEGFVRVLVTRDAMGKLLRVLLGLSTFAVVLIGWVACQFASRLGFQADTSGTILVYQTAAIILLTWGVVVFSAVLIDRSEHDNRLSERQFRTLVEGVKDYSLFLLSPGGLVSSWNSGATRINGYAPEEVLGTPLSRFYTEEDRRTGKPEHALRVATMEGRFESEEQRVRKDGSCFWAHIVIDRITDDNGALAGFTKITHDVTRQKEDADRIREVSRNLELALGNMRQGLCLFDASGRLLLANERLSEIFGTGAAVVMPGRSFGETFGALMAGRRRRDDLPVQAELERFMRRHQALLQRAERRGVLEETSSGRTVSVAHRVLADGGWLTTVEDVTERHRAEAQMAHMARHDGLTGLPNRTSFNEYLKQELEQVAGGPQQVGLIAIDLDRFKEINDLHGHAAGDAVLTTLARHLQDALGPDEFVARLGGDEFGAVVRFSDTVRLQEFVSRMEECLSTPLLVNGIKLGGEASLGVAIFPGDAATGEQLVNNADLAMYRAKRMPGEHVCYYEAPMGETVRHRRAMAGELWTAIDKSEFVIAYQVQKSVLSGATIGCEALLRWNHPDRGSVPPGEFIPIAEECGAILSIGEWVLRKACSDAATWPAQCKIAVNVSPVQLTQARFPALVAEILAETGLSAHRLELEITESTIIADKVKTLAMLQQLSRLGVKIALDDFGIGYSSLDTLRSFPFDRIKLDRSFIVEITESQQAKAVIRAILALGHSLGVPVLAEGVETVEQLALLRDEGCDEVQGYLLGRPQVGAVCCIGDAPYAIDEGLSSKAVVEV